METHGGTGSSEVGQTLRIKLTNARKSFHGNFQEQRCVRNAERGKCPCSVGDFLWQKLSKFLHRSLSQDFHDLLIHNPQLRKASSCVANVLWSIFFDPQLGLSTNSLQQLLVFDAQGGQGSDRVGHGLWLKVP